MVEYLYTFHSMQKIVLLITCAFLLVQQTTAQISATQSPSIYANAGSGVTSWSGVFGQASFTGAGSSTLRVLSGIFDSGIPDVPSNAVIKGIELTLMRSQSAANALTDLEIRAFKNPASPSVGTNFAAGGNWPTINGIITYGGPTELWGQTWTAADFGADMGVAISVNNATAGATIASLVSVTVTVYFDVIAPVDLLYFKASEKSMIALTWATASEWNNDYFVVERSEDAKVFDEVARIDGAGLTRSKQYYSYNDRRALPGTLYYRLKQVDFDGTFAYSPTIEVKDPALFESKVIVYPQPIYDRGYISWEGLASQPTTLRIYELSGKQVRETVSQNNYQEIERTDLGHGIYIYELVQTGKSVYKGKLCIQ